jgi:hypothetical protein
MPSDAADADDARHLAAEIGAPAASEGVPPPELLLLRAQARVCV